MSIVEDKLKTVRKHNNISKVVVELDGNRYRFSLTRKGLVIRKHRARKTKVLSFSAMLDLAIEQRQLL